KEVERKRGGESAERPRAKSPELVVPGRRGSGRLSSRSDDGETTSPNTPNTPITSSSLDEHHLCPDTPKIRVNDSTPTGTRPSGPSPVRSSARLRLCPPRHAHPPTRCTNCMHTAATA
ncbi:hypothetical protein C7M84_008165, partial [Penaeus vannamei]